MDHDDDFDDFGLDDFLSSSEEEIDQPPEPPTMRITIRGRRLNVEPWAPYLIGDGPHAQLLDARAERGVTIADGWLTGPDSKELVVHYLALADRDSADRRLVRWAQSVGHRRVWLPDRLVELEEGAPLGVARVECPTCGAVWQDDGAGFWSDVRKSHRFPTICVICNGDLPQWRWRPGSRRSAETRPGRSARRRSSRNRQS